MRHFFTLFIVCAAGFLGYMLTANKDLLLGFLKPTSSVYQSNDYESLSAESFKLIEWQDLLPENDKAVLSEYQVGANTQDQPQGGNLQALTDQILKSINAASDQFYQQALISTNTVNALNGQSVRISGFIVPIDFYPNQDVQNFFFVPYFGACLHFPPPPPNQMLFAQLGEGFSDFDINQAYTLEGDLAISLFEDPMGTSAYAINVHGIKPYFSQPDTFRSH